MEIRAWYCQGTRTATYDDVCDDANDDNEDDGNQGGDESSTQDFGDGGESNDEMNSPENDAIIEWTCDDDKNFCHLLADKEMTYLQARRFCHKQGIDYNFFYIADTKNMCSKRFCKKIT